MSAAMLLLIRNVGEYIKKNAPGNPLKNGRFEKVREFETAEPTMLKMGKPQQKTMS